jgi:hypothetical protein
MAHMSVDVYTPEGVEHYEKDVDNVSQINIRYQFANVVDIRIYYYDTKLIRYYQVPCKVTHPAYEESKILP